MFDDFVLPGYNGMDLVFQRTFNSSYGAFQFGLRGLPRRVIFSTVPLTEDQIRFGQADPLIVKRDGGVDQAWWEGGSTSAPVFRTADFWRYHYNERRLDLPNGVQCFFNAYGWLTEVRDVFSNRIEVDWYGANSHFARPAAFHQRLGDGQERTLTLTYETVSTSGGPQEVVSKAAFEGRVWNYEYGGNEGIELIAARPPVGPAWSFTRAPVDGALSFGVTFPQGGRIDYTFYSPGPPNVVGGVTSRRVHDGVQYLGEWTLVYEPVSIDAFNRVIAGPGGRRLVYKYSRGRGPAAMPFLLQEREVWDTARNERLEHETCTYTSTDIVDRDPSFKRDLLASVSVERGGRTFSTVLHYNAGTPQGRYADYGRPYSIEEIGDAGHGWTEREFDYDIQKYRIDRIKRETVRFGAEEYTRRWEHDDATGAVTSATTYGVTTRFEYADGSTTGAIVKAIDAHNHETSFTYDWGVLKDTNTPTYTIGRTINPDGTVASETRRYTTTRFEYDALGRLRWTRPHSGHHIKSDYDDTHGRWTSTSRSDGSREVWSVTWFDAFGRPVSTDSSAGVQTMTQYDADGRKTAETPPFDATEPADWARFEYDVLNRLVRVTHPGGATVQYAYTNAVDVTITNEDGHVTVQDWAAFGNPAQGWLMAVTDGEQHTFSYRYSGLGHITGGKGWLHDKLPDNLAEGPQQAREEIRMGRL